MDFSVFPHRYSGEISVPASKSHTIRRLLAAALADGESVLQDPLDSLDAKSCVEVCRGLGAVIETGERLWRVRGAPPGSHVPAGPLDVGNSGTTLFLALAAAAACGVPVTFTGDGQTARRSAAPLLEALSGLGVRVESKNGRIPITVCGPYKGGRVSLPCPTSQYLSALLLAAPLAPRGVVTEIDVPLLNERPYVEMTLAYVDAQGFACARSPDFSYFRVEGGGSYKPVSGPVPADFSSAAFPALAAALSGGRVVLRNLDLSDSQGDKIFFDLLESAGCVVEKTGERNSGGLCVTRSGPLRAVTADLNDTPDLLPACAALAAFSQGESRFYNVAHARIKETDRIAVMAGELSRLGAECRELPDGLVISRSASRSAVTDGHGDHRVVMALACCGLALPEGIVVRGAEASDVTYPGFLDTLRFSARP